MFLWAMLSFIPGLSYFLLGLYVFHKGRKRPLNIVFALYAFSLAIWGIFEAGHRLTASPYLAGLYIRGGGIGWCYMVSFWVHFLLIFARQERFLRSKLMYAILYVPSSVILLLFLSTDLIYKQQPVSTHFGYTALPGRLIWVYTLYYILLYMYAIYLLLEVVRKGTNLERKQAKPILFGSTAFLILGTSTNVIFPELGISMPELGTTLSMVWAVSVFYAVAKHKLFIISPSVEDLMAAPEKYPLERSATYILKEERPDRGYQVFYDQITHGGYGLCISKLAPDKVRERYGLVRTPVLWLTFRNTENSISPRDLDGLTSLVSDFVRKTDKALLFVDCLDQIKFANGFEKCFYMLMDFVKLCRENNSIMLLSLSPEMFEKENLSAIESEIAGEIGG